MEAITGQDASSPDVIYQGRITQALTGPPFCPFFRALEIDLIRAVWDLSAGIWTVRYAGHVKLDRS